MALTTRLRRRREEQAPGIAAEISGDVGGQLAVGSHIVQVSAQHGAIVNLTAPEQAPQIRPRATPAAILPRAGAALIGRERELQELRDALPERLTAELHGPGGIGKTALLRALCHDSAPEPDGIVFLRVAGQAVEDVGQQLFEALYESDVPVKPTPVELCRHLRERKVLVVLDDVRWERDDLAELMDWASASVFVLASERRCMWGDCRSQSIGGLGSDAALMLLERELGRTLADAERAQALELCRQLDGQPLSIIQAAGLAREDPLPLAAPEQIERLVRERLDPSEQRVVATLEALRPAAVHADDVAAIAHVPDAAAVLERLDAAGVAQSNSPRWNVVLHEDADVAAPVDRELAVRAAKRLAAGDAHPIADVPPLLAALAACARARAWRELTDAVRAADARLTLGGQWGAWQVALEHARAGAGAAGDRSTEAWALHQLGTRAGCHGELDVARPLLAQALELRRRLGDADGAAVTAHNLAIFDGRGGGTSSQHRPRPRGPAMALLVGGIALLLAGGTATAVIVSRHDDSDPPAAVSTQQTTTTQPTRSTPPPTHVVTPTDTSDDDPDDRAADPSTDTSDDDPGDISGDPSEDMPEDRSDDASDDARSSDDTGTSDGTSTPTPSEAPVEAAPTPTPPEPAPSPPPEEPFRAPR